MLNYCRSPHSTMSCNDLGFQFSMACSLSAADAHSAKALPVCTNCRACNPADSAIRWVVSGVTLSNYSGSKISVRHVWVPVMPCYCITVSSIYRALSPFWVLQGA